MATDLGLDSRKECNNAVSKPSLWQWGAPNGIWSAIVSGVLDEDKDGNGSSANRPDSPPEHVAPRSILSNKPTEGTSTNDGKNNQNFKDREGLSTLVKEEHIHNVAGAKNCGDDTEHTAERAGHGERDKIIGVGHFSSPDLAGQCPNQAPEDDGAAAYEGRLWDQDEGAQHPTGESGCDSV